MTSAVKVIHSHNQKNSQNLCKSAAILIFTYNFTYRQQQLNNGLPETYFGGKTLAPSSPTFQEDRSMEPVFSSRGFIPPRNGWKWWRYHEMGDHEILDHLLNAQHYDKRETPPSQSKYIYTLSLETFSL